MYRYLALKHFGFSFRRVYYGSDTASDRLLLGSALAFISTVETGGRSRRGWRRAIDIATVVAAVVLAGVVMRLSFLFPKGIWVGVSVAVVCTSVIVLNLVTRPIPVLANVLSSVPFVWVGKRSYGIYLWVTALIFLVEPLGTHGLGIYPYNALVLLAALTAATLSYRFVETPSCARRSNSSERATPRQRPSLGKRCTSWIRRPA